MSSNIPLVSIGLVSYNRGDIIHLAIEQLLSQTYKHIELIISDNASTDNTEEVCQRFVRKDRRVHYVRQEKNIGMYNNFNFVLSKAQGKFFMWATDDDEWDADYIERLITLHKKYPDAVVAASNYLFFNEAHEFPTPYKAPEYSKPPTSISHFLHTGAVLTYGLHKTKHLRKAGGFYLYPSFIPQGIGELLLIYRILLQGGVVFSPKIWWKKRDSGLTFERFDIMQNLRFTQAVWFRIWRYLRFLPLFIYDLCIQIKDTVISRYTIREKILLCFYCLRHFIFLVVEYLGIIFTGIAALLRGVSKRFLSISP